MDPIKIATLWCSEANKFYGEQPDNTAIFRFMAYWMAFNCLYSAHAATYTGHTSSSSTPSERNQIISFIKSHQTSLREFVPNRARIPEILSKPVIDMRFAAHINIFQKYDCIDDAQQAVTFLESYEYGEDDKYTPFHYNIYNFNNIKSKNDVISFIMTIYQIRCNLFHGSKSPKEARDYNLVRESAYLIQNYLATVLPDI